MRPVSPLIFGVLLATCASSPFAQTIYKTVGPDGKITLSDSPPAGTPPDTQIRTPAAQAPRSQAAAPGPAPESTPSGLTPDQDKFLSDLRRDSTRLLQQPDFERAIEVEKQAIATAEQVSPHNPALTQRWLAMAMAYRQRRNNAEAIQVYQHVSRTADRSAGTLVLLHVYNELAMSYMAVGNIALSRSYAERAAGLRRRQ